MFQVQRFGWFRTLNIELWTLNSILRGNDQCGEAPLARISNGGYLPGLIHDLGIYLRHNPRVPRFTSAPGHSPASVAPAPHGSGHGTDRHQHYLFGLGVNSQVLISIRQQLSPSLGSAGSPSGMPSFTSFLSLPA